MSVRGYCAHILYYFPVRRSDQEGERDVNGKPWASLSSIFFVPLRCLSLVTHDGFSSVGLADDEYDLRLPGPKVLDAELLCSLALYRPPEPRGQPSL